MEEHLKASGELAAGPTYSIGEAAGAVGVSTATIRLYERQGLLKLHRTPGGHRYLTEEDLNVLKRIRVLRRSERKTGLKAIRRLLGDPSESRLSSSLSATTVSRPGPKLRAFRKGRGLTLQEVAGASGLSHSFLSAFERGLTGVSANNLRRILSACGTNMVDLFSDPDQLQRKLILPDERPSLSLDDGAVLIEDLAVGPRQLEIQLWTIQPRGESDGSYSHPGEEAMFVISGELDVHLQESEGYHLIPGACLNFPSSVLHRWRNNGDEPAVVLWVNTPPTF